MNDFENLIAKLIGMAARLPGLSAADRRRVMRLASESAAVHRRLGGHTPNSEVHGLLIDAQRRLLVAAHNIIGSAHWPGERPH